MLSLLNEPCILDSPRSVEDDANSLCPGVFAHRRHVLETDWLAAGEIDCRRDGDVWNPICAHALHELLELPKIHVPLEWML